MAGEEQVEAYAAADFAAVNTRFVELFLARFPDFQEGTVVDLGCGPADIPIRLARALPRVRLVGVDGATAMLRLARRAVVAAHLADRIDLVEAVLPRRRHDGAPFDAVVSNSLLHHLHRPQVLWSEIADSCRVGAPILVVDLLRPATPRAARDLVETYASAERAILKQDFYNSLRAAFTVDEVRKQLRQMRLSAALSVERISDRHLCVCGTRP